MTPASAALRPSDTASTAAAMNWINAYRAQPDPNNVPAVMRALSRLGAFNDPDQSGAYVGFLAGALAANPERAEALIAQSLQMRRQDSWVVVRAIAYSGLPNWRELLRHFAGRMPDRQPLIERVSRRQAAAARSTRHHAKPVRLAAFRCPFPHRQGET